MLYWSLMFLIIALVAALFGFGYAAGGAAEVSRVLFFVFLGLLVLSLLANLIRKVRGAGGSGGSSA